MPWRIFFFFSDTTASRIYTLSLHDALPISRLPADTGSRDWTARTTRPCRPIGSRGIARVRSEEHTSELQSHSDLVCRLLLEKKKVVSRYRRQFHRSTLHAYNIGSKD